MYAFVCFHHNVTQAHCSAVRCSHSWLTVISGHTLEQLSFLDSLILCIPVKLHNYVWPWFQIRKPDVRRIQDLRHQQTRVVFIWWLSRRAIDYWLQWGHSYWWSWWEELKILKISVYLLTLLTEPAVGSWLGRRNSANRSGFPGCKQPLLLPPSMLSGRNKVKESQCDRTAHKTPQIQ